tara:strand:- start:60249 stop:61706 length:1458 start_codon:yes stop_codon:yes gene_type:complete
MTWLILVDNDRDLSNADTPHKVMTTKDYLSRPQLFSDSKPQIINLARNYAYQGAGYYCSLLAEARSHRAIPTVETITDLSRKALYERALPELQAKLDKCLQKDGGLVEGRLQLTVCFGRTANPALVPFARLLFDWFRMPIMRVSGTRDGNSRIERIAAASVNSLTPEENIFFNEALMAHTKRSWRDAKTRKTAKYTLAVLIVPDEPFAPSTQASLRHFARIAARMNMDVEPIRKNDLDRLAEFDALFIRSTTNIDNYTYRFARRAEQEGMPVIDDSRSMIRCTNKVYLAERLLAAGVATPRTLIVSSEKQIDDIVSELDWPVVLKIPDGSFSRGVFKCDDLQALKQQLKQLLSETDLVIAQQFLPTAFDWRIGVLSGEPLFAAKYHMARKHWQIIKHEDGKAARSGAATAVPIDQAPEEVLRPAIEAANLMGDGLYGVDLKQTEKGVFVIEVNDNPDVNHGWEDAAEKDVVWEKIVRWFWDRLEA